MEYLHCGQPVQQTEKLIPGVTALHCTVCDRYTVAGSDQWVPRGPGGANLQQRLHVIAARVEESANIDREAMYSDDDDIRWTRIQ